MRALLASSAIVAAFLASAPAAVAQQNAAFCMRGSESGALNCAYDTMAQCEQAKPGAAIDSTCIANPGRSGTTGSGQGAAPKAGGQGSPAAPPAGGRGGAPQQ